MRGKASFFVVPMVVLLGAGGRVVGQTTDWVNPAGGEYGQVSNWSAGVPGLGNFATGRFGLDSTYTVSFNSSVSSGSFNGLRVERGWVTFAMNGQTLRPNNFFVGSITTGTAPPLVGLVLDGGTVQPFNFQVAGATINSRATLVLRRGARLELSQLSNSAGSFGGRGDLNLDLSGPGTALTFASGSFGPVGFSGQTTQFTLGVTDGATVFTSSLSSQHFLGAPGVRNATTIGTGGRVELGGGTVTIGGTGTTVDIHSSGQLSGGTVAIGDGSLGGSATVRVSGLGSTLRANALLIGSASESGNSNGSLIVSSDAVAEATGSGGRLLIRPRGTLHLAGGRALSSGSFLNQGLIRGSGDLGSSLGPLTNDAAGRIAVGIGDELRFTPGTTSTPSLNSGVIELDGGAFQIDGAIDNAANGLITVRRGGSLNAQLLNNLGAIAIPAGEADVFGDIVNTGAARVTVTGNARATFFDDLQNDGTFSVAAGSSAVFLGGVGGTGTFTGAGTVFVEGDLRPGSSPGRLSFGGDAILGPAAAIEIELGGLSAASHDRLFVAGRLSASGSRVDVRSFGGFTPLPGMAFDVLSYAALEGDLIVNNLTGRPGLQISLQHLGNVGRLVMNGLPGDADLNGQVNIADFSVLAASFNQPGNWLLGDFDASGTVDIADFGLLAASFNQSSVSQQSGRVIPEPTGGIALLAVAATLGRRGTPAGRKQ